MDGWIRLQRKMLEWEWFDKAEMVQLFIYFLLKANYTDREWRGDIVKQGQFITSVLTISNDTKLTARTIRTCLKRFEITGEITVKTTNKYTLITICNYGLYNIPENDSDKQTTNKRQTNDKQTTTTKERKKEKREEDVLFTFPKPKFNFSEYGNFQPVMEMWSEYKISRRETYKTQQSLDMCYRKLVRYSDNNTETAKEIIEQSMANNWAGIFPLKKDNSYGQQKQTNNISDAELMQAVAAGIGRAAADTNIYTK